MDVLRGLKARGLGGTKLVISDAHSGFRAAIERAFEATWQRCRVHWVRNAPAHVSRGRATVIPLAELKMQRVADHASAQPIPHDPLI